MAKSTQGPRSDPSPIPVTAPHSPPSLEDPEDAPTSGHESELDRSSQDENGESQPVKSRAQSPPSTPVRRSSRRSAPTKPFDSLGISSTTAIEPTSGSRRNPKRKAAEPTRQLGFPSSELLSEALRPLEPADIEEWEGWIELESEPVGWPFLYVA